MSFLKTIGLHPMTENTILKGIKRIQDRLGIPEWTAHDLR